jgi:hypothetical protein
MLDQLFSPPDQRMDWIDVVAGCLLIAGIFFRIGLTGIDASSGSMAGEATRVAAAFAQTGLLADSYFAGQGPTAHLMPVAPAIGGMIYWLFGVGTPSADAALMVWAVLQVTAAFIATYLLCRNLGFSRLALATGALLLAIPIFFRSEIVEFRFWEGALCVFLVSSTLLIVHKLTTRRLVVAAALVAFTALTNPIVGLALFAAVLLHASGRRRHCALLIAVFSACLLGPWITRNYVQLGEPVVRSNFGLELSLSNYDGAINPADPQAAYRARIAAIHPYKSLAAQKKVRLIGEVAYNNSLGREALRWIERNPTDFARMSLRRLGDFYFPPTWTYNFWDKSFIRGMAAVLLPVFTLLGIAYLLIGAAKGRPLFRPILAFIVVIGLPYALVQPVPRYAYPIYPLLTLFAGGFVAALLRLAPWKGRRRHGVAAI